MCSPSSFFGINFIVDDMAATLAFYRRLGLDLPSDGDGEQHVETKMGDVLLAWDRRDLMADQLPGFAPAESGTTNTVEFRFGTPSDVDDKHSELVAAGYASRGEPFDAFWGARYALVEDPDGTVVAMSAAR